MELQFLFKYKSTTKLTDLTTGLIKENIDVIIDVDKFICCGYAPDNDSDGQDDLLNNEEFISFITELNESVLEQSKTEQLQLLNDIVNSNSDFEFQTLEDIGKTKKDTTLFVYL